MSTTAANPCGVTPQELTEAMKPLLYNLLAGGYYEAYSNADSPYTTVLKNYAFMYLVHRGCIEEFPPPDEAQVARVTDLVGKALRLLEEILRKSSDVVAIGPIRGHYEGRAYLFIPPLSSELAELRREAEELAREVKQHKPVFTHVFNHLGKLQKRLYRILVNNPELYERYKQELRRVLGLTEDYMVLELNIDKKNLVGVDIDDVQPVMYVVNPRIRQVKEIHAASCISGKKVYSDFYMTINERVFYCMAPVNELEGRLVLIGLRDRRSGRLLTYALLAPLPCLGRGKGGTAEETPDIVVCGNAAYTAKHVAENALNPVDWETPPYLRLGSGATITSFYPVSLGTPTIVVNIDGFELVAPLYGYRGSYIRKIKVPEVLLKNYYTDEDNKYKRDYVPAPGSTTFWKLVDRLVEGNPYLASVVVSVAAATYVPVGRILLLGAGRGKATVEQLKQLLLRGLRTGAVLLGADGRLYVAEELLAELTRLGAIPLAASMAAYRERSPGRRGGKQLPRPA